MNRNVLLAGIMLFLFILLAGCAALPEKDSSFAGSGSPVDSGIIADDSGSLASSGNPVGSGAVADAPVSTPRADAQRAALYKKIDESGYPAGIAFVGFVGHKAKQDDLRSYIKNSKYAEKYAFLCDAPLVDAGGAELYAVITTRKSCSAAVYKADIGEDGNYTVLTDKALYPGKGEDCFLLRCNVSEVCSNAAILVATGDKHFFAYPMISGKDGRIGETGCYDFSVYSGGEGVQEDIMNAYSLLLGTDEVKKYIDKGMTLQYTHQTQVIDGRSCWVFALGTDRDDQFVREQYYGVCDNLIYAYDVVRDVWNKLDAG